MIFSLFIKIHYISIIAPGSHSHSDLITIGKNLKAKEDNLDIVSVFLIFFRQYTISLNITL